MIIISLTKRESSLETSMEAWRELAIKLFPEDKGSYEDPDVTVWFVLFDLHDSVAAAHEANEIDQLKKIYGFAEWCHAQKSSDPDIWMAAYMAFYEHLVEDPATYAAIPDWLTPEVFEDVLSEFKDRLDNKEKYPMERPGTFEELLRRYDAARGTNFWLRRNEWQIIV
jgi:hypothetical protein